VSAAGRARVEGPVSSAYLSEYGSKINGSAQINSGVLPAGH
jgi:hypothetical protein